MPVGDVRLKRPIYWKHVRGSTPLTGRTILVPIYGIGPWWAHLVFWLGSRATHYGIELAWWAERYMEQQYEDGTQHQPSQAEPSQLTVV